MCKDCEAKRCKLDPLSCLCECHPENKGVNKIARNTRDNIDNYRLKPTKEEPKSNG